MSYKIRFGWDIGKEMFVTHNVKEKSEFVSNHTKIIDK